MKAKRFPLGKSTSSEEIMITSCHEGPVEAFYTTTLEQFQTNFRPHFLL